VAGKRTRVISRGVTGRGKAALPARERNSTKRNAVLCSVQLRKGEKLTRDSLAKKEGGERTALPRLQTRRKKERARFGVCFRSPRLAGCDNWLLGERTRMEGGKEGSGDSGRAGGVQAEDLCCTVLEKRRDVGYLWENRAPVRLTYNIRAVTFLRGAGK